MKKIELLAPCGNIEALEAAVLAGCDAVYLGGSRFGARAFSRNFDDSLLISAINYAHLYGVKVYVTVNTLIYDDEVLDFLNYIEFLYKNNVDAVIMQDLGMFDLVRNTFPNLEIHISTQMHIHNLDGAKFMGSLGAKRVVIARECNMDEIRKIVNEANVEVEVFVHGALCISYSGQCLMSSLIGGRSGNRGTCAGSCRLRYDVLDDKEEKLNKNSYPLSTKDLNSLEYIGELIDAGVSSLKIEGRMKSREYVYKVVSIYRKAIDSYYNNGKVSFDEKDILELKKIFNRKYTKGFLNNTSNDDLINDYRPNHMGVDIGSVIYYNNNIAKIKLTDKVSIGSGLRIIGKKGDVGVNVNDFYINNKLVKEAYANDVISIRVKDYVDVGARVLITLDSSINREIDEEIKKKNRRVFISGKFIAKLGHKCCFTINDGINNICVYGNMVNSSINKSVDRDTIFDKLNKLGNTVYKFLDLDIDIDDSIFIPISELNSLRREAISQLNDKRMYKYEFKKNKYEICVPDFKKERLVTCLVHDSTLYKNLDRKYDVVYSDSKIDNTVIRLPRVTNEYNNNYDEVMIGEIGGLNKYKNVCTDVSFNVVNSYTVAFLHSLGVKRVTLSYELDDRQIRNLIDCYHKRYKKHPNLELIVYGYEEVMISKFSLNKYYNHDNLYLRDMFGNKFRVITRSDGMHIYNYKKRDMYDCKYYDMGVNSLRFNFE